MLLLYVTSFALNIHFQHLNFKIGDRQLEGNILLRLKKNLYQVLIFRILINDVVKNMYNYYYGQ